MPGEMEKVWVKSGLQNDRVALWETDPEHPGGEVFIATRAQAPVEVALTPNVVAAIRNGTLVETGAPAAGQRSGNIPPEGPYAFTLLPGPPGTNPNDRADAPYPGSPPPVGGLPAAATAPKKGDGYPGDSVTTGPDGLPEGWQQQYPGAQAPPELREFAEPKAAEPKGDEPKAGGKKGG